MAYVYRYTDVKDGIIKYVGIVTAEGRTLSERISEHSKLDEWTKGKKWKIEYLEVANKTDAEFLESHFISLFHTYNFYNVKKSNWGTSSISFSIDAEWIELGSGKKEVKAEVNDYNNCVQISIPKLAKLLGKDAQTIRYLIQNNMVNWGMAFKKKGNKRYNYIIYPNKLYEETGIKYSEQGVC